MGLQAYQAVMCMMGGGVSGHTARERKNHGTWRYVYTAQCFYGDFSFHWWPVLTFTKLPYEPSVDWLPLLFNFFITIPDHASTELFYFLSTMVIRSLSFLFCYRFSRLWHRSKFACEQMFLKIAPVAYINNGAALYLPLYMFNLCVSRFCILFRTTLFGCICLCVCLSAFFACCMFALLYVYLYVRLPVYLSVLLPVCLSTCCLSALLYICMCVFPPISLFVCLSVRQCNHLSYICPSVCAVLPSVCCLFSVSLLAVVCVCGSLLIYKSVCLSVHLPDLSVMYAIVSLYVCL